MSTATTAPKSQQEETKASSSSSPAPSSAVPPPSPEASPQKQNMADFLASIKSPDPEAGFAPQQVTLENASTAIGAGVKRPRSATPIDTNDLGASWFHACLYGEYSTRKTTTAAGFGTPDQVRILLTRSKEQMTPLRDLGYKALQIGDAEALKYGLLYPHQEWPDWAKHPDPVLILDDATEAAALLLDDNSSREVKGRVVEFKDQRKAYGGALTDLRDIVKLVLPRKHHFIMTALAKVKESPIMMEERVGPDLPPSMLNLVLTEMDYVFFIDRRTWELVTDVEYMMYTDVDPLTNKTRQYRREIFAKNKLPIGLLKSNVLQSREKMNLRAIWDKIQKAKFQLTPSGSGSGAGSAKTGVTGTKKG